MKKLRRKMVEDMQLCGYAEKHKLPTRVQCARWRIKNHSFLTICFANYLHFFSGHLPSAEISTNPKKLHEECFLFPLLLGDWSNPRGDGAVEGVGNGTEELDFVDGDFAIVH